MPDGEMRRPPQLWEQRLSRLTSVLGVGLASGGDATAIVDPSQAPGTDTGTEPAPVLPPPGSFIKPSTPSLLGMVQGINVIWDGLNSASELWPSDTSWVEVHLSTAGTGFTPGTATMKGRLVRPGAFPIGGLASGTAYYVRLRGADPAGNYTDPSDAATGYTGLTTASDYGVATIGTASVSFNARTIGGVTNTVGSAAPSSPIQGDVWLDNSAGTAVVHKYYNGSTWVTQAWGSASIAAGQITALQMAAGAITAGAIAAGAVTTDKLTAGTISGFRINGGTISGGYISGGTISGGFISGGTVSAGYISGGTINGATITSTSVSGYATTAAIANFITGADVNANVTSISGGVITSGTIIGRTVMSSAAGAGSNRVVLDSGNTLDFYKSNSLVASLYQTTVRSANGLALDGNIDISGLLDIGTDLYLGGSVSCSGIMYANSFRPEANVIVFQGLRSTTTAGDVLMRLSSNVTTTGQSKFEVLANGDVTSRTNSYGAFSDARLKENITPARDYLDDLRDVDIVTFNWTGSDKKLLGVTAQQIQPIFPSLVTEDEDGTLGVRYSVFVPMLITAVQSLADKVDALTARIEALEG